MRSALCNALREYNRFRIMSSCQERKTHYTCSIHMHEVNVEGCQAQQRGSQKNDNTVSWECQGLRRNGAIRTSRDSYAYSLNPIELSEVSIWCYNDILACLS